jgi:hypothetical protein
MKKTSAPALPDSDQAVYMLSRIFDDPRFEGFAGFLPDVIPKFKQRQGRNWRVRRLAKGWKPLKVRGRVREFNDNPGVMLEPAFSERAVNALRELLEPNGEILPLRTPTKGRYYAFNITTIAEALDLKKSKLETLADCSRFEFIPKNLKGLSIFILRELPMEAFVTETFVRRVREHGLNGFVFLKVWPVPEGTLLWKFHKQERKKQLPKGLPTGKTLKGNVLMIFLNLANPEKANKAELAQIKRLEDDLDNLLVTNSQDVPIGSLEGHDFKRGKCRFILSCPDASALEKHLQPFLKKLKWKNGSTLKKIRRPFEELRDVWD